MRPLCFATQGLAPGVGPVCARSLASWLKVLTRDKGQILSAAAQVPLSTRVLPALAPPLAGSVVAPLAPALDAMRQGRGIRRHADRRLVVRSDRDGPCRAGRHGPRSTRTE